MAAEPWWKEHIADRFKSFRKDMKLSQAGMAKALGLPCRETVSEIEKGRRDLKATELIDLLRQTKRSLDDFWD